MSAAFPSSGSGDRPFQETNPPREQPAESSSNRVHQELLDQVLETTLSLGGGDEPLGADDLNTLIAVAKRRGGEPLSVETVTELVQAVLRLRFRTLAESRIQWERMTRQIAETLFEDPHTQERIEALWSLLRRSAA